MATLVIQVPDELEIEVRASGIHVTEICRDALQNELARIASREEAAGQALRVAQRLWSEAGRDDRDRYERGLDLGIQWASDSATLGEMWQVARWSGQRWRQFSLRPESHTLPSLYCQATGQPQPAPGEDFWLEKDQYTTGIVDGVAGVYEQVHTLI